jgi:hypothetical protein
LRCRRVFICAIAAAIARFYFVFSCWLSPHTPLFATTAFTDAADCFDADASGARAQPCAMAARRQRRERGERDVLFGKMAKRAMRECRMRARMPSKRRMMLMARSATLPSAPFIARFYANVATSARDAPLFHDDVIVIAAA